VLPGSVDARNLRHARDRVLARIAEACARAGRDPREVTLVAVSKTVPVSRLLAAIEAGFEVFGENRVQEAAAKVPDVPGARWHLVGPLQSNKVQRAVETFDAIETVDSLELATRIHRLAAELRPGRRYPVLVQVNVDRDPGKAGLAPEAVEGVVVRAAGFDHLEVAGLMTIGRLADDPEEARPTFRALRELAERLRTGHPELGPALSMGMSDDYWVAVEEGATIVRVGRALFGERPPLG